MTDSNNKPKPTPKSDRPAPIKPAPLDVQTLSEENYDKK
jgi:hypothetical protein